MFNFLLVSSGASETVWQRFVQAKNDPAENNVTVFPLITKYKPGLMQPFLKQNQLKVIKIFINELFKKLFEIDYVATEKSV